MSVDVRICLVEETDIPELASLESRSSDRPWSEADLGGSLKVGDGCYKLISGTGLIGYCVVRETGGELEVLNLVVDRSVQRQGYGGHLLSAVMQLPRYAGVSRVWLEVAQDNGPAKSLYRRLGFVHAGIRKDYYGRGGNPIDACILVKNL